MRAFMLNVFVTLMQFLLALQMCEGQCRHLKNQVMSEVLLKITYLVIQVSFTLEILAVFRLHYPTTFSQHIKIPSLIFIIINHRF